jgi:hypothetical protein
MVLLMRALLLTIVLGVAGCFDVSEPPCSYSCGPNGECPDDYSCGSDNYCHLHGTGICFFSDAAVAPMPDGSLDMMPSD